MMKKIQLTSDMVSEKAYEIYSNSSFTVKFDESKADVFTNGHYSIWEGAEVVADGLINQLDLSNSIELIYGEEA